MIGHRPKTKCDLITTSWHLKCRIVFNCILKCYFLFIISRFWQYKISQTKADVSWIISATTWKLLWTDKGLNIAFHYCSTITFYWFFKVKFKVKVTSSTSIVIMFRPGMAGLPALSRPNFRFEKFFFGPFGPKYTFPYPTFLNLLREIDVCL